MKQWDIGRMGEGRYRKSGERWREVCLVVVVERYYS